VPAIVILTHPPADGAVVVGMARILFLAAFAVGAGRRSPVDWLAAGVLASFATG
jgi:hypothetical protein